MAVIRPEKVAKIAEVKELLTNAKCTILVDYCGLTVAQDTKLRRAMRQAGVKYRFEEHIYSHRCPRSWR